MNNVHILYFASGGIETGLAGGARLRNMLTMLKPLSLDIRVFSILIGNRIEVSRRRIDVRTDATSISLPLSFPTPLLPFISVFISMLGFKNASRCNIIFAQSPTVTAMIPAVFLSKIFRKPLVLDHIDTKPRNVPWGFYRFLLRSAKVVLVLSRYLEQEASRLGCRNVLFFPIFVDTNMFRVNYSERAEIRMKYGLEDCLVVGFSGSFWRGEGIPYLLNAVKELSPKYDRLRLLIIGGKNVSDSDDVPELINKLDLQGRAIVLPKQPYDLIPRFLSSVDIACAPKIVCVENIAANPIKIYEYMSMSLPVVASAIGETTNVIENGFNGFLVKPEDTAELKASLELMLQNPKLRGKVGDNARETVLKSYSLEEAMRRMVGILSHYISKPHIKR